MVSCPWGIYCNSSTCCLALVHRHDGPGLAAGESPHASGIKLQQQQHFY